MTDTVTNIILPAGVWVDLYDESGITVGTRIQVQNITTDDVILCTKATVPTGSEGHQLLRPGVFLTNEIGDSGAWAYSITPSGVNVRIV